MKLVLTRTLLSQKPKARSFLLGLSSYVVLLLVFFMNQRGLSANGDIVYTQGEYWRAFTTTLMHADVMHLGSNTMFFLIFSVLLNNYFGFWVFPFLSLLVGGVINLIAFKVYDPQIYLVGISGVIYFMASFWMVMFITLERQMKLGRRILIALAVSLILLWPEAFHEKVSYLAHALGVAFGIPVALLYFLLQKNKLRSHEVWESKVESLDPVLEEIALSYPKESESGEFVP
ncbi:MAG: rhomboid family intramembrane serine protease [Proteobacteria bacterium]|jgi:rhomboid protease GluP|nr:rhomboid family intramembrane serine protease [Pseudomonadota bacterium]